MAELRHILVPIDNSAASERAIRYAVDVASADLASRITLLHVVEPRQVTDVHVSEQAGFDLLSRYRPLVEPFTYVLHLKCGDPAKEIFDVAYEEHPDVIVVGKSAHDPTRLGKTAQSLMRLAPCPVLTVPEP